MQYGFIIMGGGIGALLRYVSSQGINALVNPQWSLGTVFVNGLGSCLIGFLIHFFDPGGLPVKWKLLIITGFLGGYTTFSTYALETAQYFLNGHIKQALIHILLNNVLSIVFVLLGIWLHKLILLR